MKEIKIEYNVKKKYIKVNHIGTHSTYDLINVYCQLVQKINKMMLKDENQLNKKKSGGKK